MQIFEHRTTVYDENGNSVTSNSSTKIEIRDIKGEHYQHISDSSSFGILISDLEAKQLYSKLSKLYGKEDPLKISPEEMNLADQSKKIDAIRLYRTRTGTGLKEAKDAVEAYIATQQAKANVTAAWDLRPRPTPQEMDLIATVGTTHAIWTYAQRAKCDFTAAEAAIKAEVARLAEQGMVILPKTEAPETSIYDLCEPNKVGEPTAKEIADEHTKLDNLPDEEDMWSEEDDYSDDQDYPF